MDSFNPASLSSTSERIEEMKKGFFTSDLSTDEFTALHLAGFSPLGMVVGSSVYHIGFQSQRYNVSQELTVLTEAMHNARELALSRMVAEAQALGADGIVGTDLKMQTYVGGLEVVEFISIGTAIKFNKAPGTLRRSDGMPFTSHISGQDFVKLWQAGFVPVHFSFGVCVYHVAHQSAFASLKQMGRNVEMPIYTKAIYEAREIALERVQQEAIAWGATGVVGTTLNVSHHIWGESAVEFMAMGTAVKAHSLTPDPINNVTITMSMDK